LGDPAVQEDPAVRAEVRVVWAASAVWAVPEERAAISCKMEPMGIYNIRDFFFSASEHLHYNTSYAVQKTEDIRVELTHRIY
jgi:hypothetical protein